MDWAQRLLRRVQSLGLTRTSSASLFVFFLRKHAPERALYRRAPSIDHVRIDLGRAHIRMPQLLLHRADVGTPLQQVCPKRVAIMPNSA